MDRRFSPTPRDSKREAEILLYAPGVSIPAVTQEGAEPTLDLSPYVTRASHGPADMSVTLAWHLELYGTAQPKPGQVIATKLDGLLLWVGIVESISDYRVETGTRTMTLACRSRDATPAWRRVNRVTQDYPQGTRLDVIARDVAASVGLETSEINMPVLAVATPHSTAQLAAVPAWAMLETLMLPAGYEPRVDGLGRLSAFSHDCLRPADIEIEESRLVAVTGSKARPPVTKLRLRWLDPMFTKVEQQDQVLGQANITAGFFQVRQRQDVYFSDDNTQRADNTRLVIKQSANSGLLDVCDEDYEQTSETSGRIVLETSAFVPTLLTIFLAVKAAGALPDIAPTTGGPTLPIGKKVQAALEFSVLMVMASIGTGSYEVWGTPYDYVKGRNATEAYDPNAEDWYEEVQEIESDFILNEDHARAVAGREFIYQALSASSYNVVIVDDPRIEVGDILELADGSRVFVTGFRRELTHGASAVLEVEGFRV